VSIAPRSSTERVLGRPPPHDPAASLLAISTSETTIVPGHVTGLLDGGLPQDAVHPKTWTRCHRLLAFTRRRANVTTAAFPPYGGDSRPPRGTMLARVRW
jgi:hypothetical protein